MRDLILLRHAHAESAGIGQDDIDRPLSRQGLAEAEAAGKWLKAHNLLPDRILCSNARRTRETLEQGNGARRQRQAYERAGWLEEVVDILVEETARGLAR